MAKSADTISASAWHPSILGLLFWGCPFAVARLIVAVVVDAANRSAFRSFSHIGKKVFKEIPPFANRNSPASISKKLVIVRICGSLKHVQPASICSGGYSSRTMAVNEEPFPCRFPVETSTGVSSSSLQAGVRGNFLIAAFAKTEAIIFDGSRFASLRRSFCDHFKSSKRLADEGYSSRHRIGSFNFVFSGGRPASTGARCDSFLPLLTGGVNG